MHSSCCVYLLCTTFALGKLSRIRPPRFCPSVTLRNDVRERGDGEEEQVQGRSTDSHAPQSIGLYSMLLPTTYCLRFNRPLKKCSLKLRGQHLFKSISHILSAQVTAIRSKQATVVFQKRSTYAVVGSTSFFPF